MLFNEVQLYRPPFDVVMIGLLMIAIVSAVIGLYLWRTRTTALWRRVMMLSLRLITLTAIAWILAGPSVIKHGEEPGRPEVLLLTDTSASMAQVDAGRGGQISCFDAIKQTWLSPEFLTQLHRIAEVQLVAFDTESHLLSPSQLMSIQPTGSQTFLFEALQQTLGHAGHPLTVLLSDGHDTRTAFDSRVIEQLQKFGRSIFAVPVGEVSGIADLAVTAWVEADFLFEGQSTQLHANVIQQGHDHERVRVELLQDGHLIDSQTVTFSQQAVQSVRFHITPPIDHASGRSVTLTDYLVRVASEDAVELVPEGVTQNNTQHVFVQVSRDRMKIALFEGEPGWDTRNLARVLRRDPQADLAAVYQFGPKRQMRVTTGRADDAPQMDELTQATLNSFDVVILGRRVERLFAGERAAMLVDFVKQRGGALILARGRAFENDAVAQRIIRDIEPVTWGKRAISQLKLKLKLTREGRQSPLLAFENIAPTDVILNELPGLLTATQIEREKAASLVWLRQTSLQDDVPGMAAVVHQRVGRGQVMAVLGDGLWRWALLPPAQADYESVYALFWSRAVRWLATGGEFLPGQQVTMTLGQLSVEPGEPVTVTIATRYIDIGSFTPTLQLIGPTGSSQIITPHRTGSGQFQAILQPHETGIWHVALSDSHREPIIDPASPIESQFAVYDRSLERLNPDARPRILKQLTDATGGQCWAIDDTDALLDQIERIRVARQSDVRARYDFNRGSIFAIIVFGLVGEWILRRRGGLL